MCHGHLANDLHGSIGDLGYRRFIHGVDKWANGYGKEVVETTDKIGNAVLKRMKVGSGEAITFPTKTLRLSKQRKGPEQTLASIAEQLCGGNDNATGGSNRE